MKLLISWLPAFLIASCSYVPTPSGQYAVLVGGKGHLEYTPGGAMAYTYSNEKSFQHATQAVTTIAAATAAAYIQNAKETTTQLQSANATAATVNAQNNAAKAAAAAAGAETTKAGINGGLFTPEATKFIQPQP